ncbi:MAG: type II toxin-antitoxin system HicA family toxin, partial [Microcystis sp.]
FEDVKQILEAFEFLEVRSTGSHHIFRHGDGRMQTIPKKGGQKVKKVYIKQIIKLLKLESINQIRFKADSLLDVLWVFFKIY